MLVSLQQLEESSMHTIPSQDESWFPVFDWRGEPTFHKHLKWSFPLKIVMWEGPFIFCLKWNGLWEAVTHKKAAFPCSVLNSGLSFISQDEGMSEYPVENLEKAAGLHPIWKYAITSLWHLERHPELSASKGNDDWLFLKMDRNPNITVATRKWTSVFCLTSRSVRIVLPSVV